MNRTGQAMAQPQDYIRHASAHLHLFIEFPWDRWVIPFTATPKRHWRDHRIVWVALQTSDSPASKPRYCDIEGLEQLVIRRWLGYASGWFNSATWNPDTCLDWCIIIQQYLGLSDIYMAPIKFRWSIRVTKSTAILIWLALFAAPTPPPSYASAVNISKGHSSCTLPCMSPTPFCPSILPSIQIPAMVHVSHRQQTNIWCKMWSTCTNSRAATLDATRPLRNLILLSRCLSGTLPVPLRTRLQRWVLQLILLLWVQWIFWVCLWSFQ